jgi:tripartite-type tricarboxylate transporter receptor subunit TctC
MAPSKVEGPIAQKMAEAVQAGVRDPALKKFLKDAGFDAIGNTPTEFAREYEAEVVVVPDLLRQLGVTPQ